MPPTVYDGLRAYYKFEDAAAPGLDSSGYRNDATATSAAVVAGGIIGTGLRTSLATGKLVVPFSALLNQLTRVSVSVWVNLDKALDTMWGTPVFADQRGGGSRGYFLGVLPGGGKAVSFRVHNSAGTPYTATYTENAVSGWVHIVGVYEGSLVRIYRNGVSQATAAADGTIVVGEDPIESIGLGFEGLVDEFQLWGRMLTSAEVTSLYNGGAALNIVWPNLSPWLRVADVETDLASPFTPSEASVAPLAASMGVPDAVPMYIEIGRELARSEQYVDTPYTLRDSPKRIFIDPMPAIVSMTINSARLITATAAGGPTDADQLVTWWEIELLPGQVFIVAERHTESEYGARRNQIDSWTVPVGQNWVGLNARFVMQSVADGTQVWSSAPFVLADTLFNNAPLVVPTYTNPLPAVTSVEADVLHVVTAIGTVGISTTANVQTWWEVDMAGNGSFVSLAGLRFPVVVGFTRQTVTDTFTVPLGVNLNGKSVRFAARAEYDSKQVWYSTPFPLAGAGFDNSAFQVTPLPAGPPSGAVQGPTRGIPGPGVVRFPVRDNSVR